MSRGRRLNAAEARVEAAYARENLMAGDALLRRPPVAFSTMQTWDGSGVERVVVMPGTEHRIRNAAGRVIFAERAPDWIVGLEDYARYHRDRPRPLTARQRAKVVRRGK